MCHCLTCQQPVNSCSCNKSKTDNITYTGPNLPCTGVDTNDNMTSVVQKLNDAICPTTTTSTTLVPPLTCYIWEALVTQFGNSAPIVKLIDSNFGESFITTARLSAGVYTITFHGQIPQLDVNMVSYTGTPKTTGKFYIEDVDANTIQLNTVDLTEQPLDDILLFTSMYIKQCFNLPPTPTTTTSTTHLTTTTTTTTP